MVQGVRQSEAEATGGSQTIQDGQSLEAISFLSLFMAGIAGRSGKKPNELHAEFEAAMAFGLLLGREQPRLAEEFASTWERERHISPSDFVRNVSAPYLLFKRRSGKGRKEVRSEKR